MMTKSAAAWTIGLCAFFLVEGDLRAQGVTYQEGVHYTAIKNAPTTTTPKVKIVEAFSYMCTHCNDFEPYVTNWKERQKDNIEFVRYPVIFGRSSWELYARAYVTADLMGIADTAHGALMDKLWKEKTVLKSMDELANFYAGFGAKPEEFVATSKSFAVDAKLRKEQRDMQVAEIRGTPSLIVNDKYVVAAGAAVGSFQQLLAVADFLIAKELTAHAAAASNAAAPTENAAAPENAAPAGNTAEQAGPNTSGTNN